MLRRSRGLTWAFLSVAVAVLTTITAHSSAAKEPPTRRPNIILIMADDK